MNGNPPDLAEAERLLKIASQMAERDPLIRHSLAELLLKRADATGPALERRHLRTQARSLCSELLAQNRGASSRPYHTLLKISLSELQELADVSADAPAVTDKVKEVEQLLDRAKNAFPEDDHILEAEARLSEFLRESANVVSALTRAFKANSRSTFIALRLSAILHEQKKTEEAVGVLRDGLAANPTDGALHFRLGQLLMGPYGQVDDDVEYHLRHSFTRADANWVRQFWYARAAFMMGKFRDADAVFKTLAQADVPHRDKVTPRAPCKDITGRSSRFAGRVDRLFPRYAFAVRDVDQAQVFIHENWCKDRVWDRLRVAGRITFEIAFNYRGPVAIDVDREI